MSDHQPESCPKRTCPMDTPDFILRMAAIETEIRENREARHARNAAINTVIDELRVDQGDMEDRFDRLHLEAGDRMTVMEQCLARITQLLDGYRDQGGLVARVGELARAVEGMPHGTILERLNASEARQDKIETRQTSTDRKLYVATGILIALQGLAAVGAFPNLFGQ